MKIRKRKIPAVILAIWLMLGMGQMVNAQTIGAVEAESNSVEVQEPGNAETSQDKKESAAGPLTSLGSGNTISEGIYIGNVNVSGKTAGEAQQDVEAYIEELKGTAVDFRVMDGNQVEVTAGELGLTWANPEVVQEAVALGKKGNIIQRYKALQDLRHENKVFELTYDFDKESIRRILTERCGEYNTEAKDAVLTRENGAFSIIPGQSGYVIDEEASINQIYDYLINQWDFNDTAVDVAAKVQEPRGTEEELSQVKDVLGTFTTSYSSSGSSRSANVANGCDLIAGTTLYPGDEFSTYEAVSPFSVDNGYFMAGSYMNGQVVDSLGGGICQVSTTLYNAVLNAELEVTERYNHSMIVTYVDPSADAAIAESSGKDFKFRNNLDAPIYIEGITTPDKKITFTIYGAETRAPGREVVYESVVLERIAPDTEVINTDASRPVGYCSVQSAHIGYKAQLWKVVRENGVEVSREQVNSSSYMKAPRSATVGIATEDEGAYNAIMAAVATNSIDQVKAVAGAYKAAADAAAAEAAAAQAAAEGQGQPPAPADAGAPPPAEGQAQPQEGAPAQ